MQFGGVQAPRRKNRAGSVGGTEIFGKRNSHQVCKSWKGHSLIHKSELYCRTVMPGSSYTPVPAGQGARITSAPLSRILWQRDQNLPFALISVLSNSIPWMKGVILCSVPKCGKRFPERNKRTIAYLSTCSVFEQL